MTPTPPALPSDLWPKPSACRRPRPTSWRSLLWRELPKPSRRCGASTSANRWMRSSTWEPASRPIGSCPRSRRSDASYSAYSARTEPIYACRYALKLRLPTPSTCGQTPANGVFRDRVPEQAFDALMDVSDGQRLRLRRQHLDSGSLDLAVAEPSCRRKRRRWIGARLDRLVRQRIKDRLQGTGRVCKPS
jgi:hypothetical protein